MKGTMDEKAWSAILLSVSPPFTHNILNYLMRFLCSFFFFLFFLFFLFFFPSRCENNPVLRE